MRMLFLSLFIVVSLATAANAQHDSVSPRLVICGGAALPETVFQRFLKLAGELLRLEIVLSDACLDTAVEKELYQLVRRGVVIGGTSAGAAIQSRVMIAGGTHEPKLSTGFDLLPRSIVDQHFLKRYRVPRLLAVVREHPGLVAYGIDERTALVVHDGKAEVVGRSYVLRVELAAGKINIHAFGDGNKVPLGAGATLSP